MSGPWNALANFDSASRFSYKVTTAVIWTIPFGAYLSQKYSSYSNIRNKINCTCSSVPGKHPYKACMSVQINIPTSTTWMWPYLAIRCSSRGEAGSLPIAIRVYVSRRNVTLVTGVLSWDMWQRCGFGEIYRSIGGMPISSAFDLFLLNSIGL